MKKLFVVMIILLLCVSAVIGCGVPATTPAPAPAPAPAAKTTAAPAPSPAPAAKPAPTPTPSPSPTAAPKPVTPIYGGTLRVVESSGPGQPFGYPAESNAGGNQYMGEAMLRELEGGKFIPCLATSWDVNTDPKAPSITFHLRKGVKYHDGTDFNAQSFQWILQKLCDVGLNKGSTNAWKSFDVLDEYTVRINLTEWQNIALRTFSGGLAFTTSPSAFEQRGIEWARWHMVGTGAFKQVDFQRDVSLTTVRNDNYWDPGKPYLMGLNIQYVTDELTRVALLKSGGADILGLGSNGRIANELKDAGFNIISQLGYGPTVLVPDSGNSDSPWSNIKVREAAEYAIDKEALAKAFGFGYWKAAYQLNREGNIAYDSTITGRKYDPAKAKQLLTEAGYPNGFKTKIYAAPGSNKDVVVAIQAALGQVNIQVDLDYPDATKFATYTLGDYKNGLVYFTPAGWANPTGLFRTYFGVPSSYFKNMIKPEGLAAAITASQLTTVAEAGPTQKVEKMIYDSVLAIPLYHAASMYALTTKVHDTGIGTRGMTVWWDPQNTWLSK